MEYYSNQASEQWATYSENRERQHIVKKVSVRCAKRVTIAYRKRELDFPQTKTPESTTMPGHFGGGVEPRIASRCLGH